MTKILFIWESGQKPPNTIFIDFMIFLFFLLFSAFKILDPILLQYYVPFAKFIWPTLKTSQQNLPFIYQI